MKIMTLNLPQLIQRCREGDPQAMEALFHSYQDKVFRLAYSLLDDGKVADVNDEAEEATQDTFISAFTAIERFQGEENFSAWLFRITLNVCRSRLRKRASIGRLVRVLQVLFSQADNLYAEDKTLERERNAIVWRAVQQLDEKHRLPMMLHYYHDFSIAEIAEILNIRPGTVLSRLYTARDRLRPRLFGELDWNESIQRPPETSRRDKL
jgi:RNA polymerase sigma-70 factor, ECF subfamily